MFVFYALIYLFPALLKTTGGHYDHAFRHCLCRSLRNERLRGWPRPAVRWSHGRPQWRRPGATVWIWWRADERHQQHCVLVRPVCVRSPHRQDAWAVRQHLRSQAVRASQPSGSGDGSMLRGSRRHSVRWGGDANPVSGTELEYHGAALDDRCIRTPAHRRRGRVAGQLQAGGLSARSGTAFVPPAVRPALLADPQQHSVERSRSQE